MSPSKPLGDIAFLVDSRLSREKKQILERKIDAMRHIARVEILDGAMSETELLKHLEQKKVELVLVPWYRYLVWSKIEAFYGLTRTSGPTFAGYFASPVPFYELGDSIQYLRTILIDFLRLSPQETITLLRALVIDKNRAGLRPLLGATTTIYTENWYLGQTTLGPRLDALSNIPELQESNDWKNRINSIRVCVSALWSLVFEEGPGKGDLAHSLTSKEPRACLQIGANEKCLVIRLCFTKSSTSPKNILATFWPKKTDNSPSAATLLLKFADFLRVHPIAETIMTEVVIIFFPSSPADKAMDELHSFWIEPISERLLLEPPFESGDTDTNSKTAHYKPLPVPTGNQGGFASLNLTANLTAHNESNAQAKERFIQQAATRIRELKNELNERDILIKELKSGRVGSAAPLPIPDVETLLSAFQERCLDAQYQLEKLEAQYLEAKRLATTPLTHERIRKQIEELEQRHQSWLLKIANVIKTIKRVERAA